MTRSTIALLGIALLVVLVASPALAFQCPKLVNEINAAVGSRFDAAAGTAKVAAAKATELHKEGKHAEAEKAAKEGLEALGVKK